MADSTVNPLVQKRVDNATKHMDRLAPLQQECWEFFRGNHYVYRNDDNKLIQLATTQSVRGRGKPAHRVRTTRNLFVPLVRQEVSYATQRIPSYEVVPSNTDPQTISAAKLSEKVALYLYDRVCVKRATEKVVTSALVADEGFAWPYWDSTAGPVVGEDPETGEMLHEGEVKIRTFTSGEVGWEPGVRFEDSRYWVIRQARSLTDLRSEPGVIKPEKLVADGSDRRIIGSGKPTDNTDLVIVTEYLERPSAKNRNGARVTIANNREIKKPEPYPCLNEDGLVVDEPVLHKLTVIVDPDSDRDHGLVKFGLDAMRTFNDVTSKCVSYETPVITKDGVKLAGELSGDVAVLTRDGKFRKANWGERGTARLWRVEFDDGTFVHATQNHRWVTRSCGKDSWVTTPLLEGKRVPVVTLKAGTPVEDRDAWWSGVQNGIMWGDGTVERHKRGEREYVYGSVRQYSVEDNLGLLERFFPDEVTDRREYDGRPWVQARGIDPALKSIPAADAGMDYIRGFLAGALATDGHVTRTGEVVLSQKSREELEAIGSLATAVGIATLPIKRINGENGTWHTLPLDRRSFADNDGVDENLILKPYCQDKLREHVESRSYTRTRMVGVKSVTPTDRVETVYCCEEPETHTWTLAGGLITGNSLEWKNLALNPQVVGPIGTAQQMKLTDVPGAIFEAARPDLIKWREVPPIPGELFELMDRAKADLAFIFSQNDIPTQVEAGRAIQALLERDQNSRASFISNLAEFHGRLMRHMLYLVARHYTEERLLRIKGRFGWETIEGFRGADLKSQVDVRVFPSSLEPRTKASITTQVLGYADRGWISPQQAMAAINGGTAEKLIESYELDVSRANRVLQRIVKDPDGLLASGEPVDPAAPIEQLIQAMPWMPRPFDNIDIHLSVCADFMKTETYDMAEDNVRTMLDLYYQGLEFLKAQKDAQAAMQQTLMAEQQGMGNAARPQTAKPMPDMPGGSLGLNALNNTPDDDDGMSGAMVPA